ncbi:MAG: flagellar hook-associated protein FlgL, partial [Lachnospiraceae bacterium]|nr:flagellar hook-associated protein FlgL [Lachnospiraceae bacterium]
KVTLMAMRITTKMMQNTSLNNLNTNKALQEKLTTQLSTMKKITRPSDDPVIAIRSLKLNASLNKIDQYYEKNAEDAESWLQLTESAIKTSVDILTSMRTYVVQAAQGSLTADDRKAIVENLSNFEKEIYSTGNADSAGRSIFTGYRTDVPLTFKEDKEERYSIIEQRTNACLDTTTFVRTNDLADINEGNFNGSETTEYDVDSYEIHRIRLAYDDLDISTSNDINSKNVSISYKQTAEITDKETRTMAIQMSPYRVSLMQQPHSGEVGVSVYDEENNVFIGNSTVPLNGTSTIGGVTFSVDSDGAVTIESDDPKKTVTMESTKYEKDDGSVSYVLEQEYEMKLHVTDFFASGSDKAYEAAIGEENADSIVYIAETGELLLGSNVNAELSALSIDAEIQLKYDKSNWQEGDLDPIHYFHTTRYDELRNNRPLVYNPEKLTDPEENAAKQIIEYDIGSNQSIRVNTTADEVFTHDIGRDVDEVIAMLDEYSSLEEAHNAVENMIKSEKYEGDKLDKLKKEEAALDKAMTMVKDKIQKRCEGFMTDFDGYIDQAKLAQTNVGSRESRLNLIQNRLGSQQTNFQELVSENEDADVTELAIQLSSVELTYEAALSSISYVMKTSLLDFI